jgi:hypothetical protein
MGVYDWFLMLGVLYTGLGSDLFLNWGAGLIVGKHALDLLSPGDVEWESPGDCWRVCRRQRAGHPRGVKPVAARTHLPRGGVNAVPEVCPPHPESNRDTAGSPVHLVRTSIPRGSHIDSPPAGRVTLAVRRRQVRMPRLPTGRCPARLLGIRA